MAGLNFALKTRQKKISSTITNNEVHNATVLVTCSIVQTQSRFRVYSNTSAKIVLVVLPQPKLFAGTETEALISWTVDLGCVGQSVCDRKYNSLQEVHHINSGNSTVIKKLNKHGLTRDSPQT